MLRASDEWVSQHQWYGGTSDDRRVDETAIEWASEE